MDYTEYSPDCTDNIFNTTPNKSLNIRTETVG